MTENNFPTLSGQDAIGLWLKGRDAWNEWVEENPDYNISFIGVNFPKIIAGKNLTAISFRDFRFPNGEVNFIECDFSCHAVYFENCSFGNGDVNFQGTNFGDGLIFLAEMSFGDGDTSFSRTKFGKGSVFLDGTDFGKGTVQFSDSSFEGTSRFNNLKNLNNLDSLSFKYATFEGPLDISSNGSMPFLIDLMHTKTSHHVSLSGVKCTLPREAKRKSWFLSNGDWTTQKTAIDKEDEGRARRLKELAEANKDHHKAKEFHIMEMQAARTHKFPYDFLFKSEFWYEKLSDYGRSITRPLWWMAGIWWTWSIFYLFASFLEIGKALWPQAAVYSAAQMFAFIPSSRGARNDVGDALFCAEKDCALPEWIYLLTFSQSILALILLFLLGLGLRHRYRI